MLIACENNVPFLPTNLSQPLITNTPNKSTCSAKIGIILNKTLPQAELIQASFFLAQSKLNVLPDNKNCPIVLNLKDAPDSQAEVLSIFHKITADGNVPIVIAFTRDEYIQALANEAEKQQVLLLIANSTSMIYSQTDFQWVFRLPASSEQMLVQLFEWLKLANTAYSLPTMVSISALNNHGKSLQGQFFILAARYGWSVIGNFYHHEESNSTELSSSLRVLKPDVIFIFGMNKAEFQTTLRQIASAHVTPKAILFIPEIQENPFELFDSSFDVEGIIVATQWAPQISWHDKNDLTAQDIFQELSQQLSTPISPNGKILQAYTSVEIAANILEKEMQRSPNYIQKRLQAAFQSFNTQTSLWGPISFRSDGQNKHDVILIQRQARQWEIIYPIQYRTTAPRFPLPVLSPPKQ